MRSTLWNLSTAAVAAAALTLTACASTGSASASASSNPTTTPAAAPMTTTTAPTGPLVLGPTGVGPLLLGMSLDDANATGLVDHIAAPTQACSEGLLKGEHTKPDEGALFMSAHLGVAAIYAYGDVATPEGIKLGSTYDQVHAAYPSWRGIDGEQGHGLIAVPNNSNANYRIDISGGQVVELDIQLEEQDCYE
jgi:hypothetical protein